eukprot:635395-Pleurochrysis_carterae.AAC.1
MPFRSQWVNSKTQTRRKGNAPKLHPPTCAQKAPPAWSNGSMGKLNYTLRWYNRDKGYTQVQPVTRYEAGERTSRAR